VIYGYIVGQNFLDKKFDTMKQALISINKLHEVPHKEKIMWVLSERELTEKECLMLCVVQDHKPTKEEPY
jgi:hypothetical protein